MNAEKTVIKIEINTPYVSLNEFSRLTGLSPSTINRLINSGFLSTTIPTGKNRSTRLINLVDLITRAASESMTINEFIKNRNKKG